MVLIVEDDVMFRNLIKETLFAGFPLLPISEASDGVEALEKINACIPNIIFMDIKLPGENGLVLTKKIKERYPQIIIAILTAYDQPEYREAAFQCGAAYFLPKGSTSLDEIRSLVEQALFGKKSDSDGSGS